MFAVQFFIEKHFSVGVCVWYVTSLCGPMEYIYFFSHNHVAVFFVLSF